MTTQRQSSLFRLTNRLENAQFVKTVRGGLISTIPVLMIGAFCLIGRTFPVPAYQTFLHTWANGFLDLVLQMIYAATFGTLSVYMSVSIAISFYREDRRVAQKSPLGPAITAALCFFILSGVFSADFNIDALGPKGMITAILSGYGAAALYRLIQRRQHRRSRAYADGADAFFYAMLDVIGPAAAIGALFALFNSLIVTIFQVTTFYQLIIELLTAMFLHIGANFWGGLLMVLFSSLLWFFGIHGSDCLEGVMAALYTPAIDVNIQAVAAGGVPTVLLTKQFFDIFVLMGGCGSAMCLLLALLIFSRRQGSRRLARLSFFPMLFNINETMIFGLPVILNPILFLPFVLTPVICYLTSYAALASGLVRYTVASVEWTTPVLLGGYIATNGWSGLLLQAGNLCLGVLLYAPFVRMLDRHKLLTVTENYSRLVDFYRSWEEQGPETVLTQMSNSMGDTARQLAADLQQMLKDEDFRLYYQPQYAYDGKCKGAEALLRWEHPLFGMIYPPLVVRIATETGNLFALERQILRRAMAERKAVYQALGQDTIVSVNVTGETLMDPSFLSMVEESAPQPVRGLCLEITEQSAIRFDEQTAQTLNALKKMGFQLAIDDFSMGQTSINYLKNNHFDLVKLDGSLTRGLLENPRCVEITSSIVSLSRALHFSVLAEYVENSQQREALANVGCLLYQGYLYSPAVPVEELGCRN